VDTPADLDRVRLLGLGVHTRAFPAGFRAGPGALVTFPHAS